MAEQSMVPVPVSARTRAVVEQRRLEARRRQAARPDVTVKGALGESARRTVRREVGRLPDRIRSGEIGADAAVRTLETCAAALTRPQYDRAADAIYSAADAVNAILSAQVPGVTPDPQVRAKPWDATRGLRDGLDAATRRSIDRMSGRIRVGIGEAFGTAVADREADSLTLAALPIRGSGEALRWAQGQRTTVLRDGQRPDLTPDGLTRLDPAISAALVGAATPARTLRPVWSVTPDGRVEDAAATFAAPFSGTHVGSGQVPCGTDWTARRGTGPLWDGMLLRPVEVPGRVPVLGSDLTGRARRSKGPHRCTGCGVRVEDGQGLTVRVGRDERTRCLTCHAALTDRADHPAGVRDIGPDSPWRVEDTGTVSPLVAQARAIRAEHKAAQADREARAAAYARSAGIPGSTPRDPDPDLLAARRAAPALAAFVDVMRWAEQRARTRELHEDRTVRYGYARRPAAPAVEVEVEQREMSRVTA